MLARRTSSVILVGSTASNQENAPHACGSRTDVQSLRQVHLLKRIVASMFHAAKAVPVFTFFEHISAEPARVSISSVNSRRPASRNRFCFVELGQQKAALLVGWSNRRTDKCYQYFRQMGWQSLRWRNGSVSILNQLKRKSSSHFRLRWCLLVVSPPCLIPETFL